MSGSTEIVRSSATAIREDVVGGTRSATEVVEAYLSQIEKTEETHGAFLRVDVDGALAAARALDEKRGRGESLGPLAGVPVAIKDQIVTAGLETTCASRILEGFVPPYDATVVERLRHADAIVLGKTNQDEFAMGSSNENSAYKNCMNPWDPSRVPGGSSGGSAVAVSLGQAPLSLGTDTGGSIRQPAALTGVVGFKPTYGRVSRYGAIAFASSLDQIGPFANNVTDAALALEVISGHDPRDSTSSQGEVPSFSEGLNSGIEGLRIGVPREYFGAGVEPGVAAAVQEGMARLQAAGAELVDVSLPHTEYCIAVYYLIATAEASSNLARYDGVRYGQRHGGEGSLDQLYRQTRAQGFGSEVKRRIMLGTYALSSGYYDAYYAKAQKVRTLIRDDFSKAFESVDLLVTPTSPVSAFEQNAKVDDPLQMYLMDIFTISCSLAGLPGISIPCGFSEGLPVGLQLLGRPLDEMSVFRAARAHEKAFEQAGLRPPGALMEGA